MDVTALIINHLAIKLRQDTVTIIKLHAYNSSYTHITRAIYWNNFNETSYIWITDAISI